MKKERGCFEDAPFPVFELDGIEYRRCPVKLVTKENWQMLDTYENFKIFGILPYQGGTHNQPTKLIQAFRVIASEVQKEETSRREKKTRRGGKNYK
jgi:hypothetical protein